MQKPLLLLLATCVFLFVLGFIIIESANVDENIVRHREFVYEQEQRVLDSYLSQNISKNDFTLQALTMETFDVTFEDIILGGGVVAEPGDVVSIHYELALEGGEVFDSSKWPGRRAYQFTLGEGKPIRGLDEGVQGMALGGKRIITIPYFKGYGTQDFGSIPAYSTLVYEVELLSVFK